MSRSTPYRGAHCVPDGGANRADSRTATDGPACYLTRAWTGGMQPIWRFPPESAVPHPCQNSCATAVLCGY